MDQEVKADPSFMACVSIMRLLLMVSFSCLATQAQSNAKLIHVSSGVASPQSEVIDEPGFDDGSPFDNAASSHALVPRSALLLMFTQTTMDVTSPRQPYPFFPQGGNLWDDLFINNFVDLDASSGILDWDGTNWTYDGHTGEDSVIRSFAEEDTGVPVFAALDGTVTTAIYSDINDHNTVHSNIPGNYVVLDHGSGQQSLYYHLKYDDPNNPDPRYTPLVSGQSVRAGTQVGLVGSSGDSDGPHLHFQSNLNGLPYESFAGNSRPGPSWWVSQTPIRRDLYLETFNMDAGNFPNPYPPSSDPPRIGTFLLGSQYTGCWALMHSLPANSTFRLRWLRPSGSVYADSSTQPINGSNVFHRLGIYHFDYQWTPGLDAVGVWHLELSINGQVVQTAPFSVVSSASQIVNHTPYPVMASLDPPSPTASQVIFCRVKTANGSDGAPVVVDPDFDLVRYHYHWTVNGNTIRDLDSAGHADAIPWGKGNIGDTLQCSVTPVDSKGLSGQTASVSAVFTSRASGGIAVGPNNIPRLLWSDPTYIASLWSIDRSGNHTCNTFGPYTDGSPSTLWKATSLSVGPDNRPHILWNNTDGKVILWTVDATGGFSITGVYGPYTDGSPSTPWYATALATGPDGLSHILWTNPDGRVILWTVNDAGSFTYAAYGPYTDGSPNTPWSATALSVGTDNLVHVLWTNPDGKVILWNVDSGFNFTNAAFGPYTDGSPNTPWNATAIATGPDNVTRLVWNNPDGRVILWNVDNSFHFTYQVYGPYVGFTATRLSVGQNNQPRILWTGINGQAIVWNVDASGNFTYQDYGL